MRGHRGGSALGLAACLAAAALLPGAAFACGAPARTIEVAPGENVGGNAPGFAPLDLRDREVVLTFDDGPEPSTTSAILDALRTNCAPATFFVLGGPAEDHPAMMKREVAEGHAVGSHTYSHSDLSDAPFEAATRDITDGYLPVKAAGVQPTLFRFPHLVSTEPLLTWLGEHGMTAIGADIDPHDWAGDPPRETLARLKDQLREKGRGIILLHDNQPNTAKLLPDLLTFLDSEGYSIVRLVGGQARHQLARGDFR